MATLRLITACDPALLLERAADGFLVRRPATRAVPFPTVPYLLALRQGGLRDDVIELAAARGHPGWFDPPLCLFQELPKWLGAPERLTVGDIERLVVVERLLRADASSVFANLAQPAGFVEAVDRLFGELVSERVAPDAFTEAIMRRDTLDDFEGARDASLAQAYSDYLAELTRLGKADGRDRWSFCSEVVAHDPMGLARALGDRRDIRIFGLQDLRGGWRGLLAALIASPALDSVTLYTSVALPLEGLPFEHERLVEPLSPAVRLFATPPASPSGSASLIAAPDSERECDEVARRVRKLIDDGAAPHRIAIVARSARPHVDSILASLHRFGVPASARQRVRLREVPVVRAVLTLFAAAAEGWTRHGLVEIADQPYLDCSLDPRVIDHVGFGFPVRGLEPWADRLRELEARARASEAEPASSERHGHVLPAAVRITQARASFDRFAGRAAQLDHALTLPQWLDWLERFFADDPWQLRALVNKVPDDRFELARLDIAGWNRVCAIVTEWRNAVSSQPTTSETVSIAAFAAQLARAFGGDVALWTPVHRGVQVIEALAAAYRSFDHVFIVGMESGSFPKPTASSPVLDDADREALAAAGIPLDVGALWDQRERELFRVLVAGAAKALTVSFSRLDANAREVIRSVFVEELADVAELRTSELPSYEVIIDGVPLVTASDGAANAGRMAMIEREREAGLLTVHNGHITAPDLVAFLESEFGNDRRWSPTQLEEMAKCGWAYMSKRLLRLEAFSEPTADVERTTSGIVLHKTLERFYDAAKQKLGTPVFLRLEDETWAEPMLIACLDESLAFLSGEHRLGHPLLLEAKRAEFLRTAWRFLQWEMQFHDDMTNPMSKARKAPTLVRTAVDEHELKFSDMTYTQGDVTIRYGGTIDRVEVGIDPRAAGTAFVAAVDYKSTRSSTPGAGQKGAWSDGVVLQVPLYAYALSKLRPTAEVARVQYLALKQREAVHSLELYTITKADGLQQDPDSQTQWQDALTAAVNAVRQARRGEFPARPKPTCNCPSWCHGWDICRVKGGPT